MIHSTAFDRAIVPEKITEYASPLTSLCRRTGLRNSWSSACEHRVSVLWRLSRAGRRWRCWIRGTPACGVATWVVNGVRGNITMRV